jgi:hypothetical protein
MTILYTKEKLFRFGDGSELTFDAFFNLIDEFVKSDTIHYSPKYYIRNRIALYSKKEKDTIVLFTMHTTSDNDNVSIGKSVYDILSKESKYDYYIAVIQTMIEGVGEEEGKRYPAIQLYGQDNSSEDIGQEKTEPRVYKIELEKPDGRIIELRRHI